MFNLFKKKYLPIQEYAESWSLLEDTKNNTIIRINVGYKEAVGHPDYSIKMGIAIPVKEHDELIKKMKEGLEDTLDDLLLKNSNGSLVAIITGLNEPRFIEFLSYTKEGIDFAKIHQDLKDKFRDYEIQMYADQDPKWEAYKALMPS